MNAEMLRASILRKALEGNLVPQLDEEPEVNLVEEAPGEVPFEIPKKWKWVTLNSLSKRIHYGYTAAAATTGKVHLLRITDVKDGAVDWNDVPYCNISHEDAEKYKLFFGDILIARTGGTIGKSFLVGSSVPDSVFASYLIRAIPDLSVVLPKYLIFFLKSPTYWMQLAESSRGTGQPNVNATSLGLLKIPLPPLAEQKRIVEKIEELLPLVEEYGQNQERLEKINKDFPVLMEKSLLQEAISGNLVPQLNVEPEVEQIGETPEEVPFEIPEKWKWIKLKDLTPYGKCDRIDSCNFNNSTWLLNLEDLEKDSGRLLQKNKVLKNKGSKHVFKKGDVLYSKLRPYLNKVLIADEDGVCSTEIIPLKSDKNLLSSEYLCLYLKSPFFVHYAVSHSYGVKMPRLGTNDAKNALIPLPSLNEQKRIVEKLDKLMIEIQNLK